MSVTVRDLLQLLEKQGFKCALSGHDLTPDNCTLDHIKPLKDIGVHELNNCQLVVPEVNTMKGTLNQDQFIKLCCDIADKWRDND